MALELVMETEELSETRIGENHYVRSTQAVAGGRKGFGR